MTESNTRPGVVVADSRRLDHGLVVPGTPRVRVTESDSDTMTAGDRDSGRDPWGCVTVNVTVNVIIIMTALSRQYYGRTQCDVQGQ